MRAVVRLEYDKDSEGRSPTVFMPKPQNPCMQVVSINQGVLRTAAFGARLRRLRIAYRDGVIRDFADIPPALFDALIRSTDPESFVRDRVEGQYDEQIVKSA